MKNTIVKWIKILLLSVITVYILYLMPTSVSLIGWKHRQWKMNIYNPYYGYDYLSEMFVYIDMLIILATILFFSIRGLIRCFRSTGKPGLLEKMIIKYKWKLPIGFGTAFILLMAGDVLLQRAIYNMPDYTEGAGHMTSLFFAHCLGTFVCFLFEAAVITLVAQIKMNIRKRKQILKL